MQQFGENRLHADAEKSDSQSPIIEAEIVEPLDAELVDQSIVEAVAPIETGSLQSSITPTSQSWVFRWLGAGKLFVFRVFGIASIILLLAVAANIPIVQFLSFGYLLEVSGRLARKQKLRDAMIGLQKASVLGGIVLGTWLMLLPIRLISGFWYEAYLVDPASNQTMFLRIVQFVSIALIIGHICAAWFCGGKLRYFFWPIVAPFSFAIWVARRVAGSSLFRKVLSISVGWASPGLVDDICNAQPIGDWFLPAIAWRRLKEGNIYTNSRDRVWDFATSLNLQYYFWLGFKGFVGSFLWLAIPTGLLVVSSYSEGGVSVITGLLGVGLAIPIFMALAFLQAHFATDGRLAGFLEVRHVFKKYSKAPWAHLLALLLTLILALPLFFLKIEQIPSELLWTLSVVFVVFSWPARLVVGLAVRRAAKRETASRWWVRYPVLMLAVPIALTFCLILIATRYVSWYGAWSLFENHVFLLPAPFWL